MGLLIDRFGEFADGFWLTFQVSLLSAIGALVVGTFVAVLRISPLPPLRWLGTSYVNIFRNIPLTVVLVFTTFGLPLLGSNADFLRIPVLDLVFGRLSIDLPYFRFGVIGVSLYTAAFVCEALRSGVNAVAPGQAEAARALGLTFTQNLRYVVLPQSWKAAAVPLGSVIIAMIKNSALVGFFGLAGDLSQRGNDMVVQQGLPVIPVFIGVAAGFLILTAPLGLLLDRIERRQAVAR